MLTFDEIDAVMKRFEGQEIPKAVILPDVRCLERLNRAFPNGELAGIGVIISEHVPPETAWILIEEKPKVRQTPGEPFWPMSINPVAIVKIPDCP